MHSNSRQLALCMKRRFTHIQKHQIRLPAVPTNTFLKSAVNGCYCLLGPSRVALAMLNQVSAFVFETATCTKMNLRPTAEVDEVGKRSGDTKRIVISSIVRDLILSKSGPGTQTFSPQWNAETSTRAVRNSNTLAVFALSFQTTHTCLKSHDGGICVTSWNSVKDR